MSVTNIKHKESIANDEKGVKHQEFISICKSLDISGVGSGVIPSAFVKVDDSSNKPLILGYALSISDESLETDEHDGIVYLVSARNRLRLFKTTDAISSYLQEAGIYTFQICNVI